MQIIPLLIGPLEVFTYVLICPQSKEAIVIDPAGEAPRILRAAQERQARIIKIVNTHSHPDHTAGNAALKELTHALLLSHKEADLAGFQAKQLCRMLNLPFSPPSDQALEHDELISFGQVELRVIHTPGHTPDSICLYGQNQLFTGDTLFVGGVGRTDLPGGDSLLLLRSLQERLLTLPGGTQIWPGHNYGATPVSTIEQELQTNHFIR